MATASQNWDELHQLYVLSECPICTESFPVLTRLACTHAFCLTCLQKYAERQKSTGNRMSCPLCRQMFCVPPGGFESMTADNLVAQPSLIGAGPVSRGALMVANIPDVGGQHSEGQSTEDPTNLVRCVEISCSELQLLDTDRSRLLNEISVNVQRMKEHSEEMKRLVDVQCQRLIDQLMSFRDAGLSDIATREEQIRRHISIVESYEEFTLEGSRSGSSCAAVCYEKNQQNDVDKLSGDQSRLGWSSPRGNTGVESAFTAPHVLQNITGGIKPTCCTGILELNEKKAKTGVQFPHFDSNAVRTPFTQSQWITRLEPGGEVRGVTQLQDRIYIVCDHSDTVRVYDVHTFRRLNGISTNKHKTLHAVDVAACDVSNCIYVSDRHNHCVWKLSEDGHRVDKWLKLTRSSGTLSMTSDGRLLILRYNPPRFDLFGEESSSLDIYGPDAGLLNTIPLPTDMKDLQHAVEAKSGNFIVCHGENGSLHRVFEVTITGRIVRSFGGQKGRRLGQLNSPRHMAVDSEGSVYIADYHNDRILILDPTFTRCSYIQGTDTENACRPLRLSFNKMSGLLLCGFKSGHTDVYKPTAYSVT